MKKPVLSEKALNRLATLPEQPYRELKTFADIVVSPDDPRLDEQALTRHNCPSKRGRGRPITNHDPHSVANRERMAARRKAAKEK